MQVISLSIFRFDSTAGRAWAFSQMQFSRAAFKAIPNADFVKMFGTGTGEGFTPIPNLGVYAIMITWPDLMTAKASTRNSRVFQHYREHSNECWTVYFSAIASRGQWDGRTPFAVEPDKSDPVPMAVLTRATVKPRHIIPFWKHTPDISAVVGDQAHLLFKIGMGEVPWLQQVTFSIWDDVDAMKHFAYTSRAHREAIRNVRKNNWFKEELYARFRVVGAEGTFAGKDPLAGINWSADRKAMGLKKEPQSAELEGIA